MTQVECLAIPNGRTSYLRFTMEHFAEFEDEFLPTLVFKLGLDNGQMVFKFYERPMKSEWVTPADSATSLNNKMNWTSNDMARRLLIMEENLVKTEEGARVINI